MSKALDLVMLVDDNDTDNFINKRIIELTGFASNIIIKNSGKCALEYLQEHKDQPEKLPSIIFLDINMPVVDGFVFLYEFDKFSETTKKNCRVVILSSSDNKRDIDKIVDNDYVLKFVTKPLTEEALNGIREIIQHVAV
ncbi:response regulator [Rapidithrix thailandica]|uniref:Response regulator n=1 Tax=Rapidithrix thailandica TaxID=413964 RepID=A0AAW9S383_9BACT